MKHLRILLLAALILGIGATVGTATVAACCDVPLCPPKCLTK